MGGVWASGSLQVPASWVRLRGGGASPQVPLEPPMAGPCHHQPPRLAEPPVEGHTAHGPQEANRSLCGHRAGRLGTRSPCPSSSQHFPPPRPPPAGFVSGRCSGRLQNKDSLPPGGRRCPPSGGCGPCANRGSIRSAGIRSPRQRDRSSRWRPAPACRLKVTVHMQRCGTVSQRPSTPAG